MSGRMLKESIFCWTVLFSTVHLSPDTQKHVSKHSYVYSEATQNDASISGRFIDCFDPYVTNSTCGDGLCGCNEELGVAVCSGDMRPIHYVPKLPVNVQQLCFIYNNLTSIESEDFFQNVTHISRLSLQGNYNLVSIHPQVFTLLKNLTHLVLNYNAVMSLEAVSVIFTTSTLKHLEMEACALGRLPPDVFENITLPRLRSLKLKENQIEHLNFSVFSSLTELKHLELQDNRLQHTHINSVMPFKHLDLHYNNLYDFPRTCSENQESFFPKLQKLVLYDNFIETLPTEICLPQLMVLDLSDNQIGMLGEGAFDGLRFPFLTRLDLSEMGDGLIIGEGTFFNLTSLEVIVLDSDEIRLDIDDIPVYLSDCPRLAFLHLSYNYFDTEMTSMSPRKDQSLNIRKLDVSYCGMSKVWPWSFCSLPHLTELNLEGNLIYFLPDGVFDCLVNLTHLDLSFNKILIISPETLSLNIQHQLVYFDMSSNLFQCDCDLLWFQAWMRNSPSIFYVDNSTVFDYSCKNIPDTTVLKFIMNEQACMFTHYTYLTMVTVLSLMIVMVIVVVGVCRYHWHLRLLCYEMCRGPSHVRRQRLEQGHFDYDIFVSYDSEDLLWVCQHLMPQLEGQWGLRLCVHERDFSAGYIVDNIARCVESSKKILMLFSDHFVKSRWCQFELSFCLRHVMDHEDALIVVCLDEVTSRDLTSGMMAVLKTTTYLQWVDGGDGDRAFFWRRLAVALQEILPHPHMV